jgi:hypothetical protein
MNKAIAIISIFVLATCGLQAQKSNGFKTDLFSPILRTFVLKYERAITEDIGAQLGFFYTGYHPGDVDVVLNGFGITPEFRYYLSETPAPDGWYFAPNVRYMSLTAKETNTDEKATLTVISIAFNMGKQVLLKDLVLIDGWVGPSYNFRSIEESAIEDVGIPDVNGFGVRAGISIGIAF